jgi:hypothetical protein
MTPGVLSAFQVRVSVLGPLTQGWNGANLPSGSLSRRRSPVLGVAGKFALLRGVKKLRIMQHKRSIIAKKFKRQRRRPRVGFRLRLGTPAESCMWPSVKFCVAPPDPVPAGPGRHSGSYSVRTDDYPNIEAMASLDAKDVYCDQVPVSTLGTGRCSVRGSAVRGGCRDALPE